MLLGGGGCFRNQHGQLKLGFSYYYGIGTNMVAEGRALLDGLRLAQYHKINISAICTDSLALIQMIRNRSNPPWSLVPWWNSLLQMISRFHCPIYHSYREGNQLADSLANHAVQVGCNEEFTSIRDLPLIAKSYAIADARGIYNFRRKIV